MSVRGIQNDVPGLNLAMNIIATAQGVIEEDDIVKISTSSNWAVNTTAASDDLIDCGVVRRVEADSETCTVEFFNWHDVIKLIASTAVPLGSQVRMASTTEGYKIASSGIAGNNNICVAADGTTCWIMFR